MQYEASVATIGPWGQPPDQLWEQIETITNEVLEKSRSRLAAEAEVMEVDLDEIWRALDHVSVQQKLDLFKRRNPHLQLLRLSKHDPYEVAVGLLRMFQE